jgi:hypothetical protein
MKGVGHFDNASDVGDNALFCFELFALWLNPVSGSK